MARHTGRHKSSHRSRERHLAICFEVWKHPWNTNTEEFYEWFFDFDDGLFILYCLSSPWSMTVRRALLKSKITLRKPSPLYLDPLTPVPVLEGAPLLLSDSKSSQSLFNDALLLLLLLLSSVIVFFAFTVVLGSILKTSEGIAYTRPSLSTAPPPHL